MRLTLRTLLAWLDDSLPPKDVTRIGRQLHKSKFAQDLSRRIRKVVRQRRLTVPGMGKNTPIDANVIAAYLDNNLSPDQTTAVESLCLNSDVHLAEVAASHEILTILDQPVEISPETYSKFYRLVKGPEARMPADRWRQLSQKNDNTEQDQPDETKSERFARQKHEIPAINTNSKDFTTKSPIYAAAIFVVLVGMIAAYQSLLLHYGSPKFPVAQPPAIEKPAEVAVAQQPAEKQPENLKPGEPAENVAKTEQAAVKTTEKPMPEPEPVKAEVKPAAAEATFSLPSQAALQEQSKSGLILISPTPAGQAGISFNVPNTWERLTPQSNFNAGAVRFASPESAVFETDPVRIAFQPGTLLEYRSQGGPLFHSGEMRIAIKKAGQVEFQLDKNTGLKIQCPADAVLLISRVVSPLVGKDFVNPSPDRLQTSIAIVKGNARIDFNNTMHSLNQHQVLIAQPTENSPELHFRTINQDGLKDWPDNTNAEKLTAEMLARHFTPSRSLPVAVMEAETDTLKAVRDQALNIAAWLDRDDLVTNALTDQSSPNLNKSAIEALKNTARTASPAAARIVARLTKELELEPADQPLLPQLLADPDLQADHDWKKRLVSLLAHNSSLIRQLTIQHLMAIAGRDDMGYDPFDPSPKGINAWQTWLGVNPETKP